MADAASLAREIMDYLLARLREAKPGLWPNMAPPELHMANGALFGFARAGLLDDASASEWRSQIEAEFERFLAVVEDELAHPAPALAPRPPPPVERARVQEILD